MDRIDVDQKGGIRIASDHDADGARLDAAAVWYTRLRHDAPADSVWDDFAVWLAADDANRAAFDSVEALYADLDEVGSAVIAAAVTRGPAVAPTDLRAGRSWRAPSRLRVAGMAMLAASLLVFAAVKLLHVAGSPTRYATVKGETRTVSLADGTLIELNTASTLAVAFTGHERRVTLDDGEAAFRIARDPGRPFIVTVAGREVRDIGTVFNILHDAGRTVVTVGSGRVAVSQAAGETAPDRPIELAAGDQLTAQDGTGDVVSHVDPALSMSWRQGYLTYKEAPLSLVVADLNRYFSGHIVLRDKDTSVRRFSGVLKVDTEDAVLNRLVQLLPLVVDRQNDGDVSLRLKRQGD